MNARYHVVVLMLKGRKFPIRANCFLLAEAKFDNNLIRSDPVEHLECPEFTQELAWDINKHALQQHKLQRSSVKIEFYCQKSPKSARDLIGYVLLDLRSAGGSLKESIKWYPILNTKYYKSKPEVQISLYVDIQKTSNMNDIKKSELNKFKMLDYPIEAVLNPVTGIFNIGPDNPSNETFVLTVTVALATNLVQLIPSTTTLDTTCGYFFFFSLLGEEVTTQTFHDIVEPKFKTERFSAKISCAVENLRNYFDKWSFLEIHFCCLNQILGSSQIPINNLPSPDIFESPATIEGLYQVFPPKSLNFTPKVIPDEFKPVVGVSISLMKSQEPTELTRANVSKQKYMEESNKGSLNCKPASDCNLMNKLNEIIDDGAISSNFHQNNSNPALNKDLAHHEHSIHHFTFAINLTVLSNFKNTKPLHVYLRYSYIYFGNIEAIETETVELNLNSQVVVPKSLHTFEFATNQKNFQDILKRNPLIIEVRKKNIDSDVCIGVVEVNMSQVFEPIDWKKDGGDEIKGNWVEVIPVISNGNEKNEIGSLQVHLMFVDRGLLNINNVTLSNNHVTDLNSRAIRGLHRPLADAGEISGYIKMRDSTEYKAALELELWKEQQMENHKAQMAELKVKLEKSWENEFKMRDRERALLISTEKEKFGKMNEKLKKNLNEMEKREKLLECKELEFEKRSKEMEREHERKMDDLKEASRRMQDDFNHKINLERKKLESADEMIAKFKKEISEGEERHQRLLKERDNQKLRPGKDLHHENNILLREKFNLEKQLEAANKEAIMYKEHWTRALRVVQSYKDRDAMTTKAELRKHEEEMEMSKMERMVRGEKEVSANVMLELEEISKDLKRLSENYSFKNSSDKQREMKFKDISNFNEDDHEPHDDDDDDDGGDSKYSRKHLAKEKKLLLKTGLYGENDTIIRNMDRIMSGNDL